MTHDAEVGVGGVVDYDWLRQLSVNSEPRPLTALGTRRRAEAAVGAGATAWAVCAGHRMADYILDTLAGWPGDRSEEELDSLRRAAEASTLDSLTALITHDPALMGESSEPWENIRFYVSQGIPLEDVIRNVHTGQEFLMQELIDCIENFVEPDRRMAVIQATARDVIRSWSVFSRSVTQQYAILAERWQHSADAARRSAVHRILDGMHYTATDARHELGYDVSRRHLALTVWLLDADPDTARIFDFTKVAKEFAHTARSPHDPLLIRRGIASADIWIADPDDSDITSDGVSFPAALHGACGQIETGLAGFVASHEQARAARRIAQFAVEPGRLTRYVDVELVALLATDAKRARRFVRTLLGPLSQNGPRMTELRTTLATYIDNQGRQMPTAQALHTHRNTVTYRIHQIEGLIPNGSSQNELRCALELARLVPRMVLSDEEP